MLYAGGLITKVRRKLDFYPTPKWATELLVRSVPIYGGILECCSGDGAIADVLETMTEVKVWRNDIVDSMPRLDWAKDATDRFAWYQMTEHHTVSWIVSNPPFSHAPQIIPLAYEHAAIGIAMLLRLSYLEPVENRGAWLNEHPPTQLIVLPRISFTGNGKTDNVTCAWMVWEKRKTGTITVAANPKFVTVRVESNGLFAATA